MEKKGTLASPATALAKGVFTSAGRAYEERSFGYFASEVGVACGQDFRKFHNLLNSVLASDSPATSLKVHLYRPSLSKILAFGFAYTKHPALNLQLSALLIRLS